MEYHEIGERFEYDGVVLEVVEVEDGVEDACEYCCLRGWCRIMECTTCMDTDREDHKRVIYKLV